MPVKVVRTVRGEGLVSIGCTFSPQRAVDHRLIADLIFANSEQWSEFQRVRRRNPGLIRGTAIFLAISLFQTQRGLFYLVKALRPAAKNVKPAGAVK
jgi:cellulose synthase (UDP-forming)